MRASRLFHAIIVVGASMGCGTRTDLAVVTMDAGRDAGIDGGHDAGVDAGHDAGFDAAICGYGLDYIDCCQPPFGEDAGLDHPYYCCEESTDPRCMGCELQRGCIL